MDRTFAKNIIDGYNGKSLHMTGEEISPEDRKKVVAASLVVEQYPTIVLPIYSRFFDGLDSIRSEKRSKWETKWTTIIPRLVFKPTKEFKMGKEILADSLPDNTINRLLDFHWVIFSKRTTMRLSHPFLIKEGEADKASKLTDVLYQENFVANNGVFISCGALAGFLPHVGRKDLNTRTFLDYCRGNNIADVTINTIDDVQMRQVNQYGKDLGIEMHPVLGNGLVQDFSTDKPSIVVVDGYGEFQTAKYINYLKEKIPNSLFVVTVAKAKYRKDMVIDFAKQVNDFITCCDYKCRKVAYGNHNEETLIVVGDKLDTIDKIICTSFEES